MRPWAWLCLWCALLWACNTHPVTPIRPAATVVATDTFEQVDDTEADILFVIDDSFSMEQEQFSLMANLSQFVQTLFDTHAALHFATVTTDAVANPTGAFFLTPLKPDGTPFGTRDTID